MNSVRWTLVLICLAASMALVISDIWIAIKKPPVEVKTTTEETRDAFPGSEIVTTLADKAPRLAAAFAFALLAAVCGTVLEVTVGTGE